MPNNQQQITIQQELFDLSSLTPPPPQTWEENYKQYKAIICETKQHAEYCYSIEIYSPDGTELHQSEILGNNRQSAILEFRTIVNSQCPTINDSDLRSCSVPEQNRLVLEHFCEEGVPEQNISETSDIQPVKEQSLLILPSKLHGVPDVSGHNVLEHSLIDTIEGCNVDSIVLEQVTISPVNNPAYSVPEHHCHWLETYVPSKRKQHKYYRYCWKVGRKIRHFHIPGGHTKKELAVERKKEVENAIRDGESPQQIIGFIRSWVR